MLLKYFGNSFFANECQSDCCVKTMLYCSLVFRIFGINAGMLSCCFLTLFTKLLSRQKGIKCPRNIIFSFVLVQLSITSIYITVIIIQGELKESCSVY